MAAKKPVKRDYRKKGNWNKADSKTSKLPPLPWVRLMSGVIIIALALFGLWYKNHPRRLHITTTPQTAHAPNQMKTITLMIPKKPHN
jgi:hypothetical protein